jgi:alpha/beta superfamily hydrolase
LEASITQPTHRPADRKLAICLHPWSWLGGRKDDPYVFRSLAIISELILAPSVLTELIEPLTSKGYHVLRYNSRGVGASTGHASFTGFSEVEDLEAVVQWALDRVPDIRSLVILV